LIENQISSTHVRLKPNLAQVPNPKKGKPYGSECRALFRPGNYWVCVAADQASLQDRGLAHYLSPHDGGAYASDEAPGELSKDGAFSSSRLVRQTTPNYHPFWD
jgi:hypothetical protein